MTMNILFEPVEIPIYIDPNYIHGYTSWLEHGFIDNTI